MLLLLAISHFQITSIPSTPDPTFGAIYNTTFPRALILVPRTVRVATYRLSFILVFDLFAVERSCHT